MQLWTQLWPVITAVFSPLRHRCRTNAFSKSGRTNKPRRRGPTTEPRNTREATRPPKTTFYQSQKNSRCSWRQNHATTTITTSWARRWRPFPQGDGDRPPWQREKDDCIRLRPERMTHAIHYTVAQKLPPLQKGVIVKRNRPQATSRILQPQRRCAS